MQALSVIHIDEIARVAQDSEPHRDEHNHQWLDENGWDFKKVYVQDIKGNIWKTTLNIANTHDGRRILYGLSKTKRIDVGDVPSAQKGGTRSQTVDSDRSIPQNEGVVKGKKSVSGTRLSAGEEMTASQPYSDSSTTLHSDQNDGENGVQESASSDGANPLVSGADGKLIPPGAEPRRNKKISKLLENSYECI